jgi:hypothetical protein
MMPIVDGCDRLLVHELEGDRVDAGGNDPRDRIARRIERTEEGEHGGPRRGRHT